MTAIQNARADSRKAAVTRVGLCLQRVRTWFGIPAKYATAAQAWTAAAHRHPETNPAKIPRGVAVFWTGGSHGYGHVALATGNGKCFSTDILRPGGVDHVEIALIHEKWGLELAGWSEDLNGVRYYDPTPPAAKKVPAKKPSTYKKSPAK